ncbi:MAG: DnaJ domain-containing protein [Oscillospiraceae bacterium]|nr:DnaJ domain-containing protein [Oscillospiraceae bacterium]
MNTLFDSYKILGVKIGSDLADVTASYRQLCREYHPDISDNPEAEELMKQVNIAYTVLREKFKREAYFRERQSQTRTGSDTAYRPGRYTSATERAHTVPAHSERQTKEERQQTYEEQHRQAAEQAARSAEAETDSRAALHNYFEAINTYDYKRAYEYLSVHDKAGITLENFIRWRESVAKLYPMREFKIAGGSSIAVVTWGGSKIFHARKFRILITEDDYTKEAAQTDTLDKLVIIEDGKWGVFLGYREIGELTRTFEKRFESRKKRDIEKRWEEYSAGINTELDMLNIEGLKKAASKELYRHRRYGSSLTFAVIKIQKNDEKQGGESELLLCAAKTINGYLREIDIPAYAGDGVFAVLFAELGRKNAENVISRLIEGIKANAGQRLCENAQIDRHFESWSEKKHADIDALDEVLARFNKKL